MSYPNSDSEQPESSQPEENTPQQGSSDIPSYEQPYVDTQTGATIPSPAAQHMVQPTTAPFAPLPPIRPRDRKHNRLSLVGLLVLALLISGLVGWFIGHTYAKAADPISSISPATSGGALTQVAENFRTSVVQINVQSKQGADIGSGVIIDPRGYIVTNNHVIEGGRQLQVVLYDNTQLAAQITGTDPP